MLGLQWRITRRAVASVAAVITLLFFDCGQSLTHNWTELALRFALLRRPCKLHALCTHGLHTLRV